MRVPLYHNLPHKLRISLASLGNHEFVTASYMGWRDLKNGELLRIAEENGIDVLVTGDQTLLYEQNLAGRQLSPPTAALGGGRVSEVSGLMIGTLGGPG